MTDALPKPARDLEQHTARGLAGGGLSRPGRIALGLTIIALIAGIQSPIHAAESSPEPPPAAKLSVRGLGLLTNRRLQGTLRELQRDRTAPPAYDANFIEDAALLLLYRTRADGYLRAELALEAVRPDGQVARYRWGRAEDILISRPFTATEVSFRVEPGRRFYYQDLEFTGLGHLTAKEARQFFFSGEALIPMKSLRSFSPERLATSAGNLQQALVNAGYQDARVIAEPVQIAEDTGAVNVRVDIAEGSRYRVRSVAIEVEPLPGQFLDESETRSYDAIYSPLWRQDLAHQLVMRHQQQGHPDTAVTIEVARRVEESGVVLVDLRAVVDRGPRIGLGETQFRGQQQTKEKTLRRTAHLEGPWLDRVAVDRARERLSRLGVFRSVDVDFVEAGDDVRDVVFELVEGKRFNVNLLAGYGSYDQLFGGVELTQNNLWGRGHFARAELLQSFKTSRGSATYTIPQFPMEDASIYLSGRGLRREEISFTREEITGTLGIQRNLPRTHQQIGARYSYEFLDALLDPLPVEGKESYRATSVGVDWQWERRDNSLLPRRGFNTLVGLELARPEFGGDAEYVRLSLNASYHLPLWSGGYGHWGLQHGLAIPTGSADSGLPINKRFFPGGENTVRGYKEGEASPRDENGDIVGAESALVWNIELEQLITPSFSFVGFVDGVGIAEDYRDYPLYEVLWSAGVGLRWNTLVGPVRLEYGHNLNPRPKDPSGTLQVSLGFPF